MLREFLVKKPGLSFLLLLIFELKPYYHYITAFTLTSEPPKQQLEHKTV